MCAIALSVLLSLLSQGVFAWPIGPCALLAVMNTSAYTDASGDGLGLTASGERTAHGTMAGGRSIPFNTQTLVPGYGSGHVADRGREIGDGNIDVWYESDEDAWEWGRRSLPVIFFWGDNRGE